MIKRILPFFLIFSLLFIVVGCGGNSNNTADEEQDAEKVAEEVGDSAETEQKSKQEDLTVGQSLTDQGITVTLNSASQSNGTEYNTPSEGYVYLILNWTIQNDSGKDFENTVQFNGNVDGAAIDQVFVSDVAESINLGETLVDSSNLTGATIYEVPAGWTQFQEKVQIDITSDVSATYNITPDQVTQ